MGWFHILYLFLSFSVFWFVLSVVLIVMMRARILIYTTVIDVATAGTHQLLCHSSNTNSDKYAVNCRMIFQCSGNRSTINSIQKSKHQTPTNRNQAKKQNWVERIKINSNQPGKRLILNPIKQKDFIIIRCLI